MIGGLTVTRAFSKGFENAKEKIRASYPDFDQVVTWETRSYTEGDIEHDVISFWNELNLPSEPQYDDLETSLVEFIATNLLIRLYKGEVRFSANDLSVGFGGFFREIWRRLTGF